ncbi:hypothetical protein ADM98_11530 [Exiguobacterium sp. BMC-KP]|uniref:hypothetical protein n=1 Tax=Exiguobacterium sp. BMC-KP TaxID=1684312 RepID=UPI0006AA4EA9|nr:hypothetical protein [Exiguobacterium sp. BMC-KP]KOP29495.1 hypothetical protein ADM98_11530 [Exiguobacterium sp. BMC-KP]
MMQDGIYAATYTQDQERTFGLLDVEGERLHFTSWVKHHKHSEYPQRGRVISRSRVWVMRAQVEVHSEWDDAQEARFAAIKRNMERESARGDYQEKLF